jgi:hypothetical protein
MGWDRCLSLSETLLLLMPVQVFARLSQTITNGKSLLGDLSGAPIPEYRTDNPLPSGFPWGDATAFNTNYYTSSPDTGYIPSNVQETHTNWLKASPEHTTGQFRGAVLHPMGTKSRCFW